MNTLRHKSLMGGFIAIGMGLLPACGADADLPLISGASASAAGARSLAAVQWQGIQSCRGAKGRTVLPTTSDEATFGSFSRTSTRVQLRGVRLGPMGEFSCEPLDFEAVITHDDAGLTRFSSETKATCVLSSGRTLVVGGIAGNLIDVGLDPTLEINGAMTDPQDAGIDESLSLMCQIQLHQRAR